VLFFAVIVIALILATLAYVFYYILRQQSTTLVTYARVLGISASILVIIHWSPQIWTTFNLKSPGTLSILMLVLQMPGSLVVVFFQAVLNKADWTTWTPYLLTAVQQLILLILCLVYYLRERNQKTEQDKALLDFIE